MCRNNNTEPVMRIIDCMPDRRCCPVSTSCIPLVAGVDDASGICDVVPKYNTLLRNLRKAGVLSC